MNRIPIVIDVDTGTDDAICILMSLLCQDKLDIRGFTTVFGNVTADKTSRNTLDILDHLKAELPVAVGAGKPLCKEHKQAVSHGATGLGDVTLPASVKSFDPRPAFTFLYDEAVQAKGELHILAVGPLTNVALALQKYPDLTGLIKQITIMGGGLYGGNMTMTSEFNIYNDPEAAKLVFEAGIPLTMVGLDVTLKPKLPEEVFRQAGALDSKTAKLTYKIFDFMRRRMSEFGGDPPNLHDVIALAALVSPELMTTKDFYMTVETEGVITRGMTIADFNLVENKAPNVSAAVDIDIDGFWHWFITKLREAKV